MSHFSQQQLHQLRNQLPINYLIQEILSMNSIYNGLWRFQCPLCSEFNTATQEKTNLGRCFSCQKNFNTIDLVIYVKKFSFKQSVEFLLPHLTQLNHETINVPKKRQTRKFHQTIITKSSPEKAHKKLKKSGNYLAEI